MVGVLIGGQLPTHRARVLFNGQPSSHQAMVSITIVNSLYTFILILLNKYILFVIEIKTNRVNRKKIHIFCVTVASMLGYTLGATMINLPIILLLWKVVRSVIRIMFLVSYGSFVIMILLKLELCFWDLKGMKTKMQIKNGIIN